MQDLEISPRYVVDADGRKLEVILKMDEFSRILDAFEELQDIRDYDEAKATAQQFISVAELRKQVTGG